MPITPTSTLSKNYQALGIDEIANDIETVFNAVNDITPTTTVVNISSAQILAMGTTPIELLPAPGANMYYDVEKVVLEFTYGTIAYVLNTPLTMYQYSMNADNIIDGSESRINKVGTSVLTGTENASESVALNQPFDITTWSGANPTTGDGTLRAIITYTVRTFGA